MDKETEVLLRHMILSHHGLKEYGSPVQPMIPEAEVLYYIDNLDAKMHMLEKAMDKTEEGHFSTRIMRWIIAVFTKRNRRHKKKYPSGGYFYSDFALILANIKYGISHIMPIINAITKISGKKIILTVVFQFLIGFFKIVYPV